MRGCASPVILRPACGAHAAHGPLMLTGPSFWDWFFRAATAWFNRCRPFTRCLLSTTPNCHQPPALSPLVAFVCWELRGLNLNATAAVVVLHGGTMSAVLLGTAGPSSSLLSWERRPQRAFASSGGAGRRRRGLAVGAAHSCASPPAACSSAGALDSSSDSCLQMLLLRRIQAQCR